MEHRECTILADAKGFAVFNGEPMGFMSMYVLSSVISSVISSVMVDSTLWHKLINQGTWHKKLQQK